MFRLAIDAVMQGIKVSEYAEEHEELKTALTKWGTGKTGFQMYVNLEGIISITLLFLFWASFVFAEMLKPKLP
ncbi:MAG: hypothetical protein WED05_13060 [Candidatus Atabeyarchaeum deiterrae]